MAGTLQKLVESGACVAWFGLEGHFADPPSLFHPDEMSDSVYAAATADGSFICKAYLGEPFTTLSDRELEHLREVVAVELGVSMGSDLEI